MTDLTKLTNEELFTTIDFQTRGNWCLVDVGIKAELLRRLDHQPQGDVGELLDLLGEWMKLKSVPFAMMEGRDFVSKLRTEFASMQEDSAFAEWVCGCVGDGEYIISRCDNGDIQIGLKPPQEAPDAVK